MSASRSKLVLVGGGHAHMMVLANLHGFIARGIDVTVVQPSAWHYYSGMGPGMLGKTYAPDDIRFATQYVVERQGGTFVQDRAVRIDPDKKEIFLESGACLLYDVVSFNAGSFIPTEGLVQSPGDVFLVKPIEKLIDAQKRILDLASQRPATIAVVGGGPSAVEISGNLWRLGKQYCRHPLHITLYAGRRLMPAAPEKVARMAEKSLKERGIAIRLDSHAQKIDGAALTLASGQVETADILFLAVGVKPNRIFQASGLPVGPDGGLKINRFLQSTAYPDIFGGGDCIYFEDQPLDKVGVYAVRQNPVLLHNLLAWPDQNALMPFKPGGKYLLIYNLGDGTGIFYKRPLLFGGRLAFIFKDFIDRRFMKKFQAIEKEL
jgi:NADH dehydrogenase FAD-containing subunit